MKIKTNVEGPKKKKGLSTVYRDEESGELKKSAVGEVEEEGKEVQRKFGKGNGQMNGSPAASQMGGVGVKGPGKRIVYVKAQKK